MMEARPQRIATGVPVRKEVRELEIPARVEHWLDTLADLTWMHLAGRDASRLRIVTTLLHGNEPSSIRGLHRWLRGRETPAVDLWILIGAVQAAIEPPRFAHRFLPADGDLNRGWGKSPVEAGSKLLASERAARIAELLRAFRASNAEALIDLHNNTGHNPPYGVGPDAGPTALGLVSLFGQRFVHSPLALGTLVEATVSHFPSVTIECGRAGDPRADDVAYDGLVRFLERDELSSLANAGREIERLGDPIRVTLREGARLEFAGTHRAGASLTLDPELDRHNFQLIAEGTQLGWVEGTRLALEARDAQGRDRSGDLFRVADGRLSAARPWVPVMMTTDPVIARADCLFYVVEPLPTWEP